ncbi:MAG: DUF2029 domain-containing protein [Alphaproteobacteria bacterium]|nr:DUF2029 domain-containing protein [Alphaproteobacteria bacterium]
MGLIAWLFYTWVFRRDPGQDWMVFYTAARAYYDHDLPLIFDGQALTAALNERFADWLGFTLNMHPWVYPPTFLLLFLPFGALPPSLSLSVFLLIGFVAVLVAGFMVTRPGWPRAVVAFSLTLCPAVPFNVMTGQNAFYTSALLVGGFGLLGRYPLMGGALLGVVTYKPQFWLMVPVALLAARQWRAFAAAIASALSLVLASLLVFGPDIFRAWIALMTGADQAYSQWLVNGRLNGLSVFACVSILGAPAAVASVMQWLAVLAAAAIVWFTYHRPGNPALRLPILLTATMLAAPHASASDAVLLALATSFYITAPRPDPLPGVRLMLAATVWICPLFNPPSLFWTGCLTPLLLLLFLGAMVTEMREAPASRAAVAA